MQNETTDTQEETTQPQRGVPRGAVISVFVVLAGVAFLVLCFRLAAGRTQAETPNIAVAQGQVLQSAEQQRRALAEAQTRFVLDKGEDTLRTIEDLAQELESWQQSVLPLLHNDDGRRIAADTEHTKQVAALLELERPDAESLDRQRARISTLLAPFRDALQGKALPTTPDERVFAQLQSESEPARRHLAVLRDRRKAVVAIVAEMRDASAEPASMTLGQKITEVEQDDTRRWMRELAQARESVKKQNRRRLAELEVQKLAEFGEAERKRREAELEAQRKTEEAKAEIAREKAERERLITLAKSPEIQARYQVFLAKGHYSFERDKVFNTTTFPASYNSLKHRWVFSRLDCFAGAATGNRTRLPSQAVALFSYNDRPLWPKYPKSDAEWQVFTDRFREFRQLAPIWREMGLLRP